MEVETNFLMRPDFAKQAFAFANNSKPDFSVFAYHASSAGFSSTTFLVLSYLHRQKWKQNMINFTSKNENNKKAWNLRYLTITHCTCSSVTGKSSFLSSNNSSSSSSKSSNSKSNKSGTTLANCEWLKKNCNGIFQLFLSKIE